jgi:hypothetical protein
MRTERTAGRSEGTVALLPRPQPAVVTASAAARMIAVLFAEFTEHLPDRGRGEDIDAQGAGQRGPGAPGEIRDGARVRKVR